jgi:chitinase
MCKVYKRIFSVLLVITLLSQSAVYAKKIRDTQPPTAPQNLTSTAIGQTSVSLKWSASADNQKVASYLIYKNSVYIGTTTGTTYTAYGLAAATSYSFSVKAKDTSGNLSGASNILSITTASVSQASAKIVIGYYASWSAYSGYTPLNIAASHLTHINYAFANISDDLKIALGDPSVDPSNFTKLNELKQMYPQLKTLISVGGWDDSGKFSDAALTDLSRTAFADSVVAFIKQYGFNGVDIDWEYPVSGGLAGNIRRTADKTNFTLLLQKLRSFNIRSGWRT